LRTTGRYLRCQPTALGLGVALAGAITKAVGVAKGDSKTALVAVAARVGV
jgi:hypothetical protein